MNITLFSQLLQQINRKEFRKSVKTYQTDKHNKGINSWTHLVSMLFLHIAKANSIREVTNGLRSITGNLNHLGIDNKTPSKSSLSYINGHRDWATYRQKKGAVKLHTLLDFDGLMPSYLFMTKDSQADVKHAHYMTMPPNSVIVADRAYEDFKMLSVWDKDDIDFVLLLKK